MVAKRSQESREIDDLEVLVARCQKQVEEYESTTRRDCLADLRMLKLVVVVK